ncbi:MAG: DUF4432 family protein [Actinomycetota bacterium]
MADVRDRLGLPGAGDNGRVIDIRVAGGIDIEVLVDRGLDIGSSWFGGMPLSWSSPIERRRGVDSAVGDAWMTRFNGGLLTTCGPDNIGAAQGRYGLHGSHSGTPASDVRWSREVLADCVRVEVSGVIDNIEMFGRRVQVQRTITTQTDIAKVSVRDRVSNLGQSPTAIPLLYHVNLGAPRLVPGTTVAVSAQSVQMREQCEWVPDAATIPEPCDAMTEAVFEHVRPQLTDGVGKAVITAPGATTRTVVTWTADELPRLYQWVWPSRGGWALGIEPANAPMYGPDRVGPYLGARVLAAGASAVLGFDVAIEPVDSVQA